MWRLGLSSELGWPSTKQEWAELVLAAGGQGNSLLHLASWARSQSEQWEHSNLTWWFLWQMWRLLHNAAIKPDPTLRPYFLCPDTSDFNLYPASVGVFGVTAPTLPHRCTALHGPYLNIHSGVPQWWHPCSEIKTRSTRPIDAKLWKRLCLWIMSNIILKLGWDLAIARYQPRPCGQQGGFAPTFFFRKIFGKSIFFGNIFGDFFLENIFFENIFAKNIFCKNFNLEIF